MQDEMDSVGTQKIYAKMNEFAKGHADAATP